MSEYLNLFEMLCLASFKYPSLSRGGVKRPDEVLYPGALTDGHCKTQQCYQARISLKRDIFSPGLVLDNAVWDSHLSAEGRQEHHQLQKSQ